MEIIPNLAFYSYLSGAPLCMYFKWFNSNKYWTHDFYYYVCDIYNNLERIADMFWQVMRSIIIKIQTFKAHSFTNCRFNYDRMRSMDSAGFRRIPKSVNNRNARLSH